LERAIAEKEVIAADIEHMRQEHQAFLSSLKERERQRKTSLDRRLTTGLPKNSRIIQPTTTHLNEEYVIQTAVIAIVLVLAGIIGVKLWKHTGVKEYSKPQHES